VQHFVEVEHQLMFAEHKEGREAEDLQQFLDDAIKVRGRGREGEGGREREGEGERGRETGGGATR
jgi:hypothetical protein